MRARDNKLRTTNIDITKIQYPASLPVTARKDEIKQAIIENQVVVIAGETGSGKTTQIPKICLEAGRGQRKLIGHTQPRRLAARTVATRIANELKVPLGQQVGYQIRFTDDTSDSTQIKLMTDGILLNEIQQDPLLRKYDTLIIDEAHERSLNIDFILGYLCDLIKKRKDLKVIITSATIDCEKFAKHFASNSKPAPIIEVSGRTYPVQIRYRPLIIENEDGTEENIDQVSGIINACEELYSCGDGDILVFLAGEKDIRDTQVALEDHFGERYEILSLFSRQSVAKQMKVFAPHTNNRIILSTNIAETSITVPSIRYVIDPGLARISRYSNKTKVQRLPIEEISQASANQRSGRCGRVSDGIAIRLYSEENFLARPQYTQPEILRTSLASVILQMASIGLENIEKFPFIDKPDTKSIRDGLNLLKEIGAFKLRKNSSENTSSGYAITRLGRKIAKFPIDPRLVRMLIEADKHACASEVLVIVAALSMQDVRERPLEQEANADALHSRFLASSSDFLTYLTLWRYLRVQSMNLSNSGFRQLCKREFFHYLRVREWVDIVNQLLEITQSMRLRTHHLTLPEVDKALSKSSSDEVARICVEYGKSKDTPDSDDIHKSLLVGLISNIGYYDLKNRVYQGARGTKFSIWPGSALFGTKFEWVVAAEIVETSKVFARTVAKISPEWVEEYTKDLVKKTYSDPHWSKRMGAAIAYEKVLLYGLPIVADRKVLVGRLEHVDFDGVSAVQWARQSFIANALVEGQWNTHHKFFLENQRKLENARKEQDRQRNFALIADETDIFDFYDERIPENIISVRHFDNWWKRQKDKSILDFDDDFLFKGQRKTKGFPKYWYYKHYKLRLNYVYDTDDSADGLTVEIPDSIVAEIDSSSFQWLVAGFRYELIYNIVKSLPKVVRKHLVPAPGFTQEVLNFFATDPKTLAEEPVQEPSNTDAPLEVEITGFSGKLEDFRQLRNQLLAQSIAEKKATEDRQISKTSVATVQNLNVSRETSENLPNYYKSISLYEAFAKAVSYLRGVQITYEQWQETYEKLPKHLRPSFAITSADKCVIATGKNYAQLKAQVLKKTVKKDTVVKKTAPAQRSVKDKFKSQLISNVSRETLENTSALARVLKDDVTLSEFPQELDTSAVFTVKEGSSTHSFYPSLCLKYTDNTLAEAISTSDTNIASKYFDAKAFAKQLFTQLDSTHIENVQVAVELCESLAEQQLLHAPAVAQLLLDTSALSYGRIITRWTGTQATILALSPYKDTESLIMDAQYCAIKQLYKDYALDTKFAYPSDAQDFSELKLKIRDALEDYVYEVLKTCVKIFEAKKELELQIKHTKSLNTLNTSIEIQQQLQTLVYDGFLRNYDYSYIKNFDRYIKARCIRLQKAGQNIVQEQLNSHLIQSMVDFIKDKARTCDWKIQNRKHNSKVLINSRFMVEEYIVSVFAQSLGTSIKVSDSRIKKYLKENLR